MHFHPGKFHELAGINLLQCKSIGPQRNGLTASHFTGGNGQPWEFVIVRERETRHRIADYYLKQLEPKREMDMAVRGTAKMAGDGEFGEKVLVALARAIPMKRIGRAEGSPGIVAFLASGRSSYVNAQCVFVDGGI